MAGRQNGYPRVPHIPLIPGDPYYPVDLPPVVNEPLLVPIPVPVPAQGEDEFDPEEDLQESDDDGSDVEMDDGGEVVDPPAPVLPPLPTEGPPEELESLDQVAEVLWKLCQRSNQREDQISRIHQSLERVERRQRNLNQNTNMLNEFVLGLAERLQATQRESGESSARSRATDRRLAALEVDVQIETSRAARIQWMLGETSGNVRALTQQLAQERTGGHTVQPSEKGKAPQT